MLLVMIAHFLNEMLMLIKAKENSQNQVSVSGAVLSTAKGAGNG
jgi:hypothetical protein